MSDYSCIRAFQIPELLRFVHQYATPRTRVSLLQVSRSFFSIGAPVMWESVEGVQNLLRLIPRTVITTSRSGTSRNLIIALPSALDLGRFNLYARYIRNLEIYCPNNRIVYGSMTLTNWMTLSAHSRGHVLLPNLSQLTLRPLFGWEDDSELFMWTRTFMSPSLTAIHMTGKSHVSFPTASALLRHAMSNCPNLHKLSLITWEQHLERTHTKSTSALAFWDPSYYEALSSLPLRELCCNASILLPANIYALVQLQSLERLELHSEDGLPVPNIPSSQMLPLLNTLVLVAERWPDIIDILKLNVYSGVKSLTIRVAENYNAQRALLDDTLMTSLTVLIASCCPTLIDLEIKCTYNVYSPKDVSVFQMLAGLRLRSVNLMGISVPHPMLEEFVSFFPLARTIGIPDSPLDLVELHYFSQLPNLVRLSVELDVSPFGASIPPHPVEVLKAAPNFQILEITSSTPTELTVDLSPLARHLLSVWPNLKQVIWSDGLEPDQSDREINIVIANALNAFISTHRIISTTN